MEPRKKILVFARAIEAVFTSSEWTELGYMTGTEEWIDRHPRLLRSLSFGDDDYKGHVFEAVKYILEEDPENVRYLATYEPITAWLKENDRASYAELTEEIGADPSDEAPLATTTDAGLAALADAQALLRSRGPTSAVDRVHTGFHAFLRAACDGAGLAYPADPTANQLLKLILENHPSLDSLGPRSDDVRRILRSSANIVDSLGTLRNRASLAHPNQELLEEDEALLVINVARALLRYLDTKVSR